jgi:autotransporter-associated beta strand protein
VLQFGLANNNSNPDAAILTDGTALDGTRFVRPLNKYGTGILTIAGDASYTGGTTILGGALQLGTGGASGSILGDVAFCSDATNSLCDSSTKSLAFNRSDIYTFAGAISGPGQVAQIGAGTTILAGDNAYTGGTIISAGTLQVTNNNSVGTGVVTLDGGIFQAGANGLNFFNPFAINSAGGAVDTNGNTLTLAGVIADGNGPGGLAKIGAGTLILTGANSYTGPTFVDGGILSVEGSIASSPVLVNAGATLAGTGTAGAATILSGGTLAPGAVGTPGTLTIQGNLAFQSGALYLVQVNPAIASNTNVSGTASLAGTVGAMFLPGTYFGRSYAILTAAGGLTGTFDALATSGLPAAFHTSLSYTATSTFLNLRAELVPEPPLPVAPTPSTPSFTVNELNVGHAIDNFFNNGGALPPAFVSLFNLSGANLANALSQLSGEAATGAQTVAFQLTNQFLNLMLDPFVDGRSGVGGADHPALGFAPERETMPPAISLAYASVLKEPRAPLVPVYEPRWTAWGGAYGGSNRTSGDIANIGSHDLSASTAGFAAGLDYRYTPDTVLGFALAGGGTNWSLSQGLGGGKSDAFQAGVYGATKSGPAYLAAAFAFTNHWMSTDRFAVGDHLTANFDAQSYGGRLEGGYRFATPYAGITPYAAIQAQNFHTPGYTETGLIPSGFALSFNGRDATDTRSELGARFDRVLAVYSNAVLALRGRLAWAHDWVNDPTLMPVFQALPGASFIVNGATPAKNSALTSAGAELRLASGVTLLARFDGEFASHSSTYGGTGTLRYRW